MLKRKFTYTNYEGLQVTEDLYFNLSAIEISRLAQELANEGQSLIDYLQEVMESNDVFKVISLLSMLVEKAYGQRLGDNRFSKSPEIVSAFVESAAFEAYVDELIVNPEEASAFSANVLGSSKLVKLGAKEQLAQGNNSGIDEDVLRTLAKDTVKTDTVQSTIVKAVPEPTEADYEAFKAFMAQRNK